MPSAIFKISELLLYHLSLCCFIRYHRAEPPAERSFFFFLNKIPRYDNNNSGAHVEIRASSCNESQLRQETFVYECSHFCSRRQDQNGGNDDTDEEAALRHQKAPPRKFAELKPEHKVL